MTPTGVERELRVAAVMTGGVSLAVWMGGVAAEIFRLAAALDDRQGDAAIYRRLLERTATRPRLDVITGASAGGLNGALLAAAWRRRLPIERFFDVRDVWLEQGSVESLLRPLLEQDAPSLFRGDDHFAVEIERVLRAWSGVPATPGEHRPVDLTITVTTLTGEPVVLADDFGERIHEVDHRQRLVFREEHFDNDRWVRELALAGRTTASLPFAFEPSMLPVGATPGGRPDLGATAGTDAIASFGANRWAIDGGMVANRPIRPALERIFEQAASRQVRRVLAYVNPTPAGPRSVGPDEPGLDNMPSLRKVVFTGFQAAPWNQTIRDEVYDLRAWNRRIRRQRDGRRDLLDSAMLGARDDSVPADNGLDRLAALLLHRYREVRAARSVEETVAVIADLAAGELGAPVALEQCRAELLETRTQWLPTELDVSISPLEQPWRWGVTPVEYAVSTALDLLARALELPFDGREPPPERADICRAKERVHDIRRRVGVVRAVDRAYWQAARGDLGRTLHQGGDLSAWAGNAYQRWPEADHGDLASRAAREFRLEFGGSRAEAGPVTQDEALRALALCANELAVTVVQTAPMLATLCAGTPGWAALAERAAQVPDLDAPLPTWDAAVAARRADLAARLRILVPVDPAEADAARRCLERLIVLHVVQTALEGDLVSNEQPVELLQMSWNAPNEVIRRAREDKVTGTELFRLGAFAKSTWRANDWMWGRMDGAARLAALLVDPAWLRQRGTCTDEAVAMIDAAATTAWIPGDARDAATLHAEWQRRRPAVEEELSFLDDASRPLPTHLPRAVAAVTFALQVGILQDELPRVHREAVRSKRRGGHESDYGDFREEYEAERERSGREHPPAAAVGRLLEACRIGEERLGAGELLSNAMAPTVAHAFAVGSSVLEGKQLGVPLVPRLARKVRLRWVALGIWALVAATVSTSKLALAGVAAVVGAALAILALRLFVVLPLPAVLAALGAIAVVVLLAVARAAVWRAGRERRQPSA